MNYRFMQGVYFIKKVLFEMRSKQLTIISPGCKIKKDVLQNDKILQEFTRRKVMLFFSLILSDAQKDLGFLVKILNAVIRTPVG